jgi:hypothetical protein
MNLNTYISKQTGKEFLLKNTLYYDCHITSLAHILNNDTYYEFLTISSIPKIEFLFHGLYCRTILDSELKRDNLLFDEFNIKKTFINHYGEIENIIKYAIKTYGYCVARVDSFYHEFFKEFYLKEHRTNGHKITVIDWDDEYFYGIDNVGYGIKLLKFKINYFLESIYSNIIHVYDKDDSLYVLAENKKNNQQIENLIKQSIEIFLKEKLSSYDIYKKYYSEFVKNIEESLIEPRQYSQIHNSYSTALQIKNAYEGIIESYFNSDKIKNIWSEILINPDEFIVLLNKSKKLFDSFKMQCRIYESSKNISKKSLSQSLKNIVDLEKNINEHISKGIKYGN